jgi:triacylglycerol lipase
MTLVTTWKDLLRPGDATNFFTRDPHPRFDPALRSYHPANAWWLAELCRLIYRHDIEEQRPPPHPTRSSFLSKVGLRQVAFFDDPATGTQAFLVKSDGAASFAALVFRGTEQDLRDFRRDLETLPTPVGGAGVRVHDGFLRALDSVWDGIVPALESLPGPIFYAGHSLGAALATLAASRRAPNAVYAFGSPRIGNEAFASSLAAVPLYRVVDDADLVATLPPEALGFRHAGELHQLVPPKDLKFNLLRWLQGLVGPPKPLADHAPINYVDRIV